MMLLALLSQRQRRMGQPHLEAASARRSVPVSIYYIKDVALGEEQCLIHRGQGPTVMAVLRDAAVSLVHQAGVRQISARLRYHSQHPAAAIALLLAAPSTHA
jgi:hypothetical protein